MVIEIKQKYINQLKNMIDNSEIDLVKNKPFINSDICDFQDGILSDIRRVISLHESIISKES